MESANDHDYTARLGRRTENHKGGAAWQALFSSASPKRLQDLQALRTLVTLLPIEETVAERFGAIRAPLLDAGLAALPMDMLNAATALVHSLTMVTHNVADYANVPGLIVVDWMVPCNDRRAALLAGLPQER